VPKRHIHLINHSIRADGPTKEPDIQGGRIARDEKILVEAVQVLVADAAGEGWDVVYVGLTDHGGHCCVDVFGLELD